MNAIVVYNEKSGVPGDAATNPTSDELREAFARAGLDVDVRGESGSAIETALRQAVKENPKFLFAGGGDGTISTAAGMIAGTEIILGILPLGTLNHFSRDVGIPTDWREAVTALAEAPVQSLDVAEVNGRVFINNCSIGSYAEAVRRRDRLRRERGHGKWRAMIAASWTVFRELRRLRLQINLPDVQLNLRTPFLLVGNNRYTGSALSSSLRPKLNEGKLWLYTTRAHRFGALLRLIWQTITRRIDAADELEVHAATEATIISLRGGLPVAADGELIDVKPPLRFRIRPGALRVLVPAKPTAK